MTDAVELNEARIIEAARQYAAADKSDPFAFDRAMCHIRTGLCGPCEQPDMLWCNGETRKSKMTKIGPAIGAPGHYDAKRITVGKQDALGNHYMGTDYIDVKRL